MSKELLITLVHLEIAATESSASWFDKQLKASEVRELLAQCPLCLSACRGSTRTICQVSVSALPGDWLRPCEPGKDALGLAR